MRESKQLTAEALCELGQCDDAREALEHQLREGLETVPDQLRLTVDCAWATVADAIGSTEAAGLLSSG